MPSTEIQDYWRRAWGIGDRERVGFADGPPGTKITPAAQKRKEKLHIKKYGKILTPFEAKSKGWEKRVVTPDADIRARLIETGKIVQQHNGKFIFADVVEQAAFDDALDKRYSSAKTSTSGKQAGVLSNDQIYEKFLKDNYSRKSVDDLIFRHKKANDLEYVKLSNEEKQAHKVEREKLLKQYQVKRISGTTAHPAHHLYSLGDEFDIRTKDIVIIPKKVNARLQNSNRKMLTIAKERVSLLSDVNIFNAKNIEAELKAIDAKAEKVINEHYKKFPEDRGLLKYRKINAIIGADGSISFAKGNSIGGDSSKWIQKDMSKDISKLDKNELKVYRDYLLKKAKIEDLKRIEGVDTADKLKTEKTSSRTKPQIFARKILDQGQGIWKKLPLKNFRLLPSGALAATDFTIMSLLGVPFPTAAVGASSWLSKSQVGARAAGTQAQAMGFMDEIAAEKAEKDEIENALAAERLKTVQKTAEDIKPFELDEKKEERLSGVDKYIINRHR